MLLRSLLMFALMCGMLFAPLAMATARAHPPEAVSHCPSSGDRDDQPAPKKFGCVGKCSAVGIGVVRLEAPRLARFDIVHSTSVSSLDGVLLERDTPPPRLA